jgi:3-deoxy-7-phosphoheptulonate synthase
VLGSIDTLERVQTPLQVVEGLPKGSYADSYQPAYPDQRALLSAVAELEHTTPVTTPEHILGLRDRLRGIARGEDDSVIVMDGRCAEPVRMVDDGSAGIEALAEEAVTTLGAIAASGLARVLHVRRCCGQCCKPRSNEFEQRPDGSQVASFMGDMINGLDINDRTPDPTRLVSTALQARDVMAAMSRMVGGHVYAGHEALSLAYEQSFILRDPLTGRKALTSADLPWIGVRTNRTDKDNPHIDMLAEVENAVGVKVGPDSDAQHIAELAARLNPAGEDGKLVYMIRVGDDRAAMQRILAGIKMTKGKPVIMFDIHGSTVKKSDGSKVRSVDVTIEHIRQLAEECALAGLKLHGVHIETMGDNSRKECVDTLDQDPTHKGDVDPQFNPQQTKDILDGVAPYLQPAN